MKKNYFFRFTKLFLFIGGLFFSSGILAQDITTGLILNYDFETLNGGTSVADVSGNNNAGTLTGTRDTVGYNGHGVFCGVKTNYIMLPANINAGLTSFTYASWVKLDALKNATRFFDLGSGANATNNFLAFVPSYNVDNGFMCLRYRPATGTAYNLVSTTKCPVGSWAHVAVTYDWNGTTGTATIYLNGANVGSLANLTYNISTSLGIAGATSENYLGISRWAQDLNGFDGTFDDVRFYNRALTATDILTMNGLAELNNQYANLSLGDISAVTSKLTLPTTAGTKGVTIRWASSKPAIIDTLGNVTQPSKYDVSVTLTATLTQTVNGKVYNLNKSFTAKVIGIEPTPVQIATWNFTSNNITLENDTLRVLDVASGFKGTIMNEARIRTIGSTEHVNVLDLGSGKGYFDMGQNIGQAIYALADHTIMGYFRVDDTYTNIAAGGNYYWNFSNSGDVGKYANGFMYGRLNAQAAGLSAAGSPSTSTSYATAAAKGGWHHFAYTLKGTTGTVYVDGVNVAQNAAMLIPSNTLPKDNLSGTICNWLGRSGWLTDAYLQQTLLFDFRVLSVTLTGDDLNFGFEGFDPVISTLDKLNTAYAENPDYLTPELQTEKDNLSIGDLSAVKSNIILPTKGILDPTVFISWKTTNNKLIDINGNVMRPYYYNYNDTLTAVLQKNGQQTTKVFAATVIKKDNSEFKNDLLVKYDFSNVTDSLVTDVAEKHFTGTLKNKAKVHSIGATTKYNVLSLGDSIGYFDLGPEIGKLIYNQSDYTVGAYYRIDTAYTELSKNGNFLFSFANGTSQMTDQNGYIIGSLLNQSVSISPKYYTAASGNEAVSFATAALQGGWHHFGYTQSGTTGTVFVDGIPIATGVISNLPKTALPKQNLLGTPYNWIGRSCYSSDVYLRKTLVYDFRLYSRALNDTEIQNDVLNVGNTISALDAAYLEDPTEVKQIKKSDYTVTSSLGLIKLIGLNGNEKITIFDVAGRHINTLHKTAIAVKSGVYIVKINNYITKLIVR